MIQDITSKKDASGFLLRLSSLILFLLCWGLAAYVAATPMLPGPWEVAVNMFSHIHDGDLLYHTGVTLLRVAVAFALSMVIGTAIGIFMGRSKTLDSFFDGWLVLGLNFPALVIIILCYIWFGLTEVVELDCRGAVLGAVLDPHRELAPVD